MGNLYKLLPFIYISIIIGSLAIIGFPFLSGFYSKDVILELIYSRLSIGSLFIYNIALLAALFTTIYSVKLIFYVFFTNRNFNKSNLIFWNYNNTENLNLMFISLASLIILSIISGYLFNDLFLGYGTAFYNNAIIIFNYHFNFIDIEYIHPFIKNLPIILCLVLILIINLIFNNLNNKINLNFSNNILNIFIKIQFFYYYALLYDKIYNEIYSNILNYTYLISTKYMDKGILELIGPFGLYKLFIFLNNKIQHFIKPLIFYYLFIFFFFIVFLIWIIIIIYTFNFNIFVEHFGLILIINLIVFFI